MLMRFTKMLRNSRSVGLAVALIVVATHAQAQAVRGPFATFPGSWSGGGAISLASGAVERLHCTAEYRVDDSGATLMQNLNCASDSYKFDLKNQVQATGSDITGQWIEVTRGAEGAIVGRVGAGRVEGTVSGPGLHRHLLAPSARQSAADLDPNAGGRHSPDFGRAHPSPLTRSLPLALSVVGAARRVGLAEPDGVREKRLGNKEMRAAE